MTERPDSPGVRFPPPLLFAAGSIGGLVLDRRVYALPLAGIYMRVAAAGELAVGDRVEVISR